MKTGIIFSLLVLSCIWSSQAQNHNGPVKGQVLNAEGEALVGALIAHVALPDSLYVMHTQSDEDGCFEIDVLDVDNSLLEISYLGYEKQVVTPSREVFEIRLQQSQFSIAEVIVRGAQPTLKKESGKFIYSPTENFFIEGFDSFEILKHAPLLTIQGNTISMLGKGNDVTIYINGRKPVMDQTSVLDILKSTPADRIEKAHVWRRVDILLLHSNNRDIKNIRRNAIFVACTYETIQIRRYVICRRICTLEQKT